MSAVIEIATDFDGKVLPEPKEAMCHKRALPQCGKFQICWCAAGGSQYPLSRSQRSDRAHDFTTGILAKQHSSRGLVTFAFQFRLGQRHVVYGTGEWIDDHLGREPVIVFVAEVGIGPADHPDD